MAEPRRSPAGVSGRPPSDSLVRPERRRLRRIADSTTTPVHDIPTRVGRGWLLAVVFSAIVWAALAILVVWLLV